MADFIASRNTSLAFSHGKFRKTNDFAKLKQEYVREAVEEHFGRFFDAVESLGGNPLPEKPAIHSLKSKGNFREDALQLRTALGLPKNGPIEDIVAILENQGVLVMFLDEDDQHFAGMNGTVNGYPYIVINGKMNDARIRTTIAHELAHIMFEEPQTDNEEKYITRISGAFLFTPEDLVRELGQKRTKLTKDLEMVCKEYGISMYLLVTRAEQENVISTAVARDFFIKANRAGWRMNEPTHGIACKRPSLFKQLVYRAINENQLSIQKGAELLQIPYPEVMENCMVVEV